MDSKYSVTDIKRGWKAFSVLWDLVALALIPKLAAHFNRLNGVKKRKEKKKASVGECLFVYLSGLTLQLGC